MVIRFTKIYISANKIKMVYLHHVEGCFFCLHRPIILSSSTYFPYFKEYSRSLIDPLLSAVILRYPLCFSNLPHHPPISTAGVGVFIISVSEEIYEEEIPNRVLNDSRPSPHIITMSLIIAFSSCIRNLTFIILYPVRLFFFL